MSGPDIGDIAPDFTAKLQDETEWKLSDALNKTGIILYFYPKDSTPGCTTEGQNFRDLFKKFKKENTVIFGLSRESIKSHENFKEKQAFPFELISDPDEKICNQFDVIKEKSMYGRKYMGIDRSTFVIDEKGKLIKEWRKVKVTGHAQEVLDYIKSL